MPTKTKNYERIVFTPEVIKRAVEELKATLSDKSDMTSQYLSIEISSQEGWRHDSEEEFFADYRKGFWFAIFEQDYRTKDKGGSIKFMVQNDNTRVTISLRNRTDVEKVFNFIETNVEKCRLPTPPTTERPRPRIKIFIGHGHSPLWRELKDHLHEKHGLDVETYEVGARAGLTIKEVLDTMLTSSSFALLVMAGEDQDAGGKLHARENVIHELGLFQGRLGWRKSIVLLEDDVEEFSNIQGLNQIRFNKGRIQETFGEVLATIKREFP